MEGWNLSRKKKKKKKEKKNPTQIVRSGKVKAELLFHLKINYLYLKIKSFVESKIWHKNESIYKTGIDSHT